MAIAVTPAILAGALARYPCEGRRLVPVMESTLPDLLALAAARGRGGWFFHAGRDVVVLPVRELAARARERSSELVAMGAGSGTRIGLIGQNRPEWAEWAWATWLAGATLVPLPAPVIVGESFAEQTTSLLVANGCSAVVGEERYLQAARGEPLVRWDWSGPPPAGASLRSPAPRSSLQAGGDDATVGLGAVSPSDVATILFTSGSTAAPKAVRLTHARAVEWARHNALDARGEAAPATVTWFPFHHIAGLGGLFEIVAPVDLHVVDVRRFWANPASWLRLVSETRARYAVNPSSVWSDVLEAVGQDPHGIDLSHLEQVAFNAELADADVMARLSDVGRALGLRPGAIAVHYASSEAGMISQTAPGSDPRVDVVDLAELVRTGRARAGRPGGPVKRVVSCGRPYPGAEVCVGAPGSPLPEREVGEVWVRGPGVTDGYVDTPGDDRLVEGWLRVGDLAYLAEGELFVTGRLDDVVVCFGEKHHPEDIEREVSRATGLASRACVAFSPQGRRGGELVVVVETDVPAVDVARTAAAAAAGVVGVEPAKVLVVPPGTVPTTPNGKLQRSRLRQMYARGQLAEWEA